MSTPEKNPALLESQIPLANSWPRFFARHLDISLEMICISCLLLAIVPGPLELLHEIANSKLWSWLFFVPMHPLILILDAWLYKIAGNTPGKALLGLKVLTIDCKALSFIQYLKRNFSMWFWGLGLAIFPISFFTMVHQIRRISNGKQTNYDESTEFRVLQLKSLSRIRKITYILVFLSLIAMSVIPEYLKHTTKKNLDSVLKNYSWWENPNTQLKAKIDARWNYSSKINAHGIQLHQFFEPTDHVAIMLTSENVVASEAAAEERLANYVHSFRNGMNFPTKGYFFTKDGYRLWEGSVVEGSKYRMSVQIVQARSVFFIITTLQTSPYAYSDIFAERLRVALWSTFPRPR